VTHNPATIVKVGWPATGSATVLTGVRSSRATVGRSSRYDAPTAGTLTVNLDDKSRRYDPLNTAGPYYGNLKVRRPISLFARWTNPTGPVVVDVPVWSGYVDDIVVATIPGSTAVTITAIDLIGLLNFTVSDPASNRPAETCRTRLRYLVGLLGLTVTEATVDVGRMLAPMELNDKNVLALIRGIEIADMGRFQVEPDGAWSYTSNLTDTVATIVATGSPTFAVSPQQVPLTSAPMSSALARYFNSVTAARFGGIPQTMEDSSSFADYGRRSLQPFTELPLLEDSDARDVANWILLRSSNDVPRPKSATIPLGSILSEARARGHVGGSDYTIAVTATSVVANSQSSTLAVVTNYATGSPSSITTNVIVDKITHDTAPGQWAATLDVSPIPSSVGSPMELDNVTTAVLGTAILGFT
jgi:hypothetical protein